MKPILILFFFLSAAAPGGEKKPCCSATEEFAAFGKNIAFVAMHDNPEPFTLQAPEGGMKMIPSPDGVDARVYVVPAPEPTENVLFVFQEWWGLNDYIKREAENLRKALGNVTVIALDLYDGKVAETQDSARAYVSRADENRIRTIIAAAAEYAGNKARIATVGWCFGGGWSLQAALQLGTQAAGCVIYYGMPEKDVERLKTLHCDVLGIFGTKDGFINPRVVEEFEKNMREADKNLTVKNYDAAHAFANPSNPRYDKEMTAQANAETVAFLKNIFSIKK